MRILQFVALAISIATPAFAQKTLPVIADASSIDPVRLSAAHDLLEVIIPPVTREKMIESMITSMMGNLSQSIFKNPEMKVALETDPRASTVLQRFFTRQQENSLAIMKEDFPGMIDAMAHAYARRFTIIQLADMQKFFETPTGRIYAEQSATIMNDPDIAKWQRDSSSKSISLMLKDAQAAVAEIKALTAKDKTGG